MTQQVDPAPIQEPGIGGPVDLAGVERFRKIRSLAGASLALAMFAAVVTISLVWPDGPARFPLRSAPSASGLVMLAFVLPHFALSVDVGNRLESRLACLGAVWAIVLGISCTLGGAAVLDFWAPALPRWLSVAGYYLEGFVAVLSYTLPWTILAHRRRKRLVRAAGG